MAKKKISSKLSVSDIAKKYIGSGIATDYLPDPDELFWVPTSSPVLNHMLGGGAAYGRIIEIAGKESSGKTLIALDIIKNAQALGGVGVFVDAEYAFSKGWAELNGLEMEGLFIYEENVIELIADFVAEIAIAYRSKLVDNEPIVLVIDSVAALDTQEAMAQSAKDKKAEMGGRAKAFYHLLRVRNKLWVKLGITVIFINQLRDTINTGFGSQYKDKVTTVGGNALKFYASQRIFLEAKKQLTSGSSKNKHRYGVQVVWTMKKNKLAVPKVPRRVDVIFDPEYGDLGFDKFGGLADILIKDGVIDKSSNAYAFFDDTIANSRAELDEVLADDEELRDEILDEAGIMTVTKMIERLEDAVDNRYPVEGISFEAFETAKDKEEDDDE